MFFTNKGHKFEVFEKVTESHLCVFISKIALEIMLLPIQKESILIENYEDQISTDPQDCKIK